MELLHTGTVRLETPRLTLRRFRTDDAPDMFVGWANDPAVTRYLSWRPHRELRVTRDILEVWEASYQKSDFYNWAITPNPSDTVIGSISLYNIDAHSLSCEAGYCLARAWWGRGVMTEALQCVMNYAFYTLGFHRLHAKHDTRNPASGRVMQKAGMQYEGVSRQCVLNGLGEFADCCCYAALRSDFQ